MFIKVNYKGKIHLKKLDDIDIKLLKESLLETFKAQNLPQNFQIFYNINQKQYIIQTDADLMQVNNYQQKNFKIFLREKVINHQININLKDQQQPYDSHSILKKENEGQHGQNKNQNQMKQEIKPIKISQQQQKEKNIDINISNSNKQLKLEESQKQKQELLRKEIQLMKSKIQTYEIIEQNKKIQKDQIKTKQRQERKKLLNKAYQAYSLAKLNKKSAQFYRILIDTENYEKLSEHYKPKSQQEEIQKKKIVLAYYFQLPQQYILEFFEELKNYDEQIQQLSVEYLIQRFISSQNSVEKQYKIEQQKKLYCKNPIILQQSKDFLSQKVDKIKKKSMDLIKKTFERFYKSEEPDQKN